MFEQVHQNPSVTTGEDATSAPAFLAHRLVLANVRRRLLSLGATTDPQQPERGDGYGQPQPLRSSRVFHPRMLPLPAAPLAVLETLFDPTAQAVPGSLGSLRRQVTQEQPGFSVLRTPPAQQGADQLPPGRRERRASAAPTHPHLGHHLLDRP